MEISINSKTFSDKDILFDCYMSQKQLVTEYINATLNAKSIAIKEQLANIINDELVIEQNLFLDAQNRNIYAVKNIDISEIDNILQSITNGKNLI